MNNKTLALLIAMGGATLIGCGDRSTSGEDSQPTPDSGIVMVDSRRPDTMQPDAQQVPDSCPMVSHATPFNLNGYKTEVVTVAGKQYQVGLNSPQSLAQLSQ